MRVISLNANGLRAASRKGFLTWLAAQNADVVCIQETKAQPDQLQELNIPLPYVYYQSAEKRGYSGVAIFSRHEPLAVQTLGWQDIDFEGRFLEARFRGGSIISLYMHSGSSSDTRQALKEQFMARFLPYLQSRREENLIVCGDWNIAHTEADIRNWKGNLKNSGFLPHERAWLSALFAEDYRDAFRLLNQEAHQYTWWSQRGRARANNVGWRIDYQVISQRLAESVKAVAIAPEPHFSDHAPLIVDYQLDWF